LEEARTGATETLKEETKAIVDLRVQAEFCAPHDAKSGLKISTSSCR
jgi:hypothetical protein